LKKTRFLRRNQSSTCSIFPQKHHLEPHPHQPSTLTQQQKTEFYRHFEHRQSRHENGKTPIQALFFRFSQMISRILQSQEASENRKKARKSRFSEIRWIDTPKRGQSTSVVFAISDQNREIPRMAKKAVKPKSISKSEILNSLAEKTGNSRKEAGALLEALEAVITENVAKGPGIFTLPGLVKIYVHTKPATKERTGTNPRTGEPITYAPKPARKMVKVKALKKLKDLI
jgi:nucleoid DNA-binding protein